MKADKPAKLKSGLVLIDVTTGRAALARRVRKGESVRVIIHATIDDPINIGNDDGTSIEFHATPTKIVEE